MLLTRRDRDRQVVGCRCERAGPACIVRARRVEGEVEVEDRRAGVSVEAEIGAFYGVDQVAAATVGRLAARGVGEREEDALAVTVVPGQLELVLLSLENEARDTDSRERERAAGACSDLRRVGLGVLDRGDRPLRRVVVVEPAERERPPASLRGSATVDGRDTSGRGSHASDARPLRDPVPSECRHRARRSRASTPAGRSRRLR